MKKLLAILGGAMICISSLAQPAVKVKSVKRIALPDGYYAENQVISPDGSFVVISDGNSIHRLDVATNKVKKITSANGAYNLAVSPDGGTIAYFEPSFEEQFRYVSLKTVATSTGKTETLVAPSRKLGSGVNLKGNRICVVNNGKSINRTISTANMINKPTTPTHDVVATINYGHLDVTVDGVTRTIDPQGRGSYLWPHVSPDGTKIVYYSVGDGCFVCDLDGSNVKPLGHIRAAVWAGDDMIVGMEDYDDGKVVTESRLVASDLKGDKLPLTDNSVIAMYPSASSDGGRVAFSTGDAIYILNLEKQ